MPHQSRIKRAHALIVPDDAGHSRVGSVNVIPSMSRRRSSSVAMDFGYEVTTRLQSSLRVTCIMGC
jgi:hypothetical protein